MNEERAAFGPRLRRAREARGLTLTQIAQTTKVKASLFAGLERNDVSQWPSGIFRRAFMRDYAIALGLSPEPLVAEFVRLFPEPGCSPEDGHAQHSSEEMRLTLMVDTAWKVRQAARHALAAAVDVGAVLLAGALIAWAVQASFLSASSVVGLGYYTLGTVFLGRSAASCWLAAPQMPKRPLRKQPQPTAEMLPRDLVDLMTTRTASEALRPH